MSVALPRSKVKKSQTWNAESLFASPEAFDIEVKSLIESLPAIKAFEVLGEYIDRLETLTSK